MAEKFTLHPFVTELGAIFESEGFELALVGGSVRDMLMQKEGKDLDFATSAQPNDTYRILTDWVNKHNGDIWDIGKEFGTIGALRDGMQIEITTYRTDEYDETSRKPLVKYGDTLDGDLSRRDFTVNSIALRVPSLELVDPFGGISDIGKKLLRTPIEPQKSFDDDPLRILRAIRFSSTLNFGIEAQTAGAIVDMYQRLEIVSNERIRDEFSKIILSDNPKRGIETMIDSGVILYVLPELDLLQMEIDEHHHHKDVYQHTLTVLEQAMGLEDEYLPEYLEGSDDVTLEQAKLTIRLAALMHDIGKPQTRRFAAGGKVSFTHHDVVGAKITKHRLRELKYDKAIVKSVARLVELHMRFYGYGEQKWTDSAVRRYGFDAGELLPLLHILTRADVTTRNERKASRLSHAYDDVESRLQKIHEQEEFKAIRPDLDGEEIMQLLNLKPGPNVGKAYKYMLSLRIDEGPKPHAEAVAALLAWWNEQV